MYIKRAEHELIDKFGNLIESNSNLNINLR